MTTANQPQPSVIRPRLHRALGAGVAMSVVVGNVIGSGIFLKPGNIASACGNFPLIISVWVAAGLLCALGAICFAELATMFPEAGGPYVYLRHAYGKLPAFLFGWTELLLVRPASIAALSTAFVGSFALAVGWSMTSYGQVLVASSLIVAMAWINIVGVLWGGRLQLLVTVVKGGFLVLVALAPLLAGWSVDPGNFAPVPSPRNLSLAAQLGVVLMAVMWAYDGWHGVTPLAEEIENPQRNVPLALFGGIGILMLLYVSANIAYHSVLSNAELQAAGNHAAEQMLFKLAGAPGRAAVSVAIMLSTFGAINSNLLLAPRVTFAMGRDRTFFRGLGAVHVNYRTPVVAIVVAAVTSIGLMVAVALGKFLVSGVDASALGELSRRVVESLQQESAFELLTNFVVFSVGVFFILCVVGLMVLRRREPHLERPYRTWGYPVVPIVFVLCYVAFMAQAYLSQRFESQMGLLGILLGVPVYFAYQKWGAGPEDDSPRPRALP
ncbi:MAG: amino acid permease [Planctomycetales bacterium]|nr:amino acid permease [Planctomycetales bacterium]